MSGNREELAKRLAAWARDELGLSTPKDNLPTACPSKEELKILCRGNMVHATCTECKSTGRRPLRF